MGQTTIVLMLITILSKILGFVRESVMAAYIGAGELKSIYTTSMTIPTIMTGIVIAGIRSSYIPVFNKVRNERGDDEANKFTSNIINILMIYGIISITLIIIFSMPISKIFSPDLEGDSLVLASNFTKIMSIAIFASLYASVIGGFLNIKGNFIDPIIIGFISNIFIIISTILTSVFKNPYILIIGTFLGTVFQFIRFPFVSKKLGYKHNKIIDFRDKYLKYLMVMIIPIILSSAANRISVLFDNSMASAFFGVASVSKIFYAKTMLNFITGVVTLSVATVNFPQIAKLGQEGRIAEMAKSVYLAIIYAMLLVLPSTFGMMALSNPIIKLAFERNAFTIYDTHIVSSLLIAYGPSIIFEAFFTILKNAFYSVGNSKTPVVIVIIQQVLNIILNLLLSRIFGLNGLAYSTSLSSFIATLMIIAAFYKKFGNIKVYSSIKSIGKIFGASIVMSVIVVITYNKLLIRLSYPISLLISILVGGLMYMILIRVLRVPEYYALRKTFLNKIKERK